MKKQLIAFLAFAAILSGCSTSTNLPTTNTGTSLENSSTLLNVNENTVSPVVNEGQTDTSKASLQKNTFVTFTGGCSFYRCNEAIQNDENGNAVSAAFHSPAGYQFLEVDALPEDYLLMIKDGSVFSYQPSTKKITPFTANDTKMQLTLKKDEGLYAKEAFNKKGEYLLIAFQMNSPSKEDGGPFINTSASPIAFYTYDSLHDTLLTQKNSTPMNNFISNSSETVKGDIVNTEFLYDAILQRTISWNYITRELYKGPFGDYSPRRGPVKITSLDGTVLKVISGNIVTTVENSSKLFIFDYGDSTLPESNLDHPIRLLKQIIVLDTEDKEMKEKILSLSSDVRAFLDTTGEARYNYSFPHNVTFTNTQLLVPHNEGNIIFTLTGDKVTHITLELTK